MGDKTDDEKFVINYASPHGVTVNEQYVGGGCYEDVQEISIEEYICLFRHVYGVQGYKEGTDVDMPHIMERGDVYSWYALTNAGVFQKYKLLDSSYIAPTEYWLTRAAEWADTNEPRYDLL